MKVLVIGANGRIGRILVGKLAQAGHEVRGMIRNPEQGSHVEQSGAKPVIGDLEEDFEHAFEGCEAVVFTAGSGGKTGGDKTILIDLYGAIKSIRFAEAKGIKRFVMVSALHADNPEEGNPRIRHYHVAKMLADERLEASSLDYTILRPGGLTDDSGTGRIQAAGHLEIRQGTIPREDVADVVVECLRQPATVRKAFDLLSDGTPISEAMRDI